MILLVYRVPLQSPPIVMTVAGSSAPTGTLILLDPRVVTKGYGRNLLDSLPPIPRDIA